MLTVLLRLVLVQVLLLSGFPSIGVAFRRGSLLRIGFIAVVSFCYFVWPVAAWCGSVSGGG